ncbi:MAG: hypothetical protein M1819_003343 [Sarea resinae]|nr:MAG: hypothetical protein M1819_003343 [Sarea resinae]
MPSPTTIHEFRHPSSPYLISTDPHKLSLDAISAAFSSSELYSASPLQTSQLATCLRHSLCLGLYLIPTNAPSDLSTTATSSLPSGTTYASTAIPSSTSTSTTTTYAQIGLARLVTDHVTFAYLTDVYVLPDYRGRGLARWLLHCVDQVLGRFAALRRTLCIVRKDDGVSGLYEECLGMREFGSVSDEQEKQIEGEAAKNGVPAALNGHSGDKTADEQQYVVLSKTGKGTWAHGSFLSTSGAGADA